MRYALPGSLLVHAAVLGAGLLMFGLPEPEDAPAMGSVSVEIIGLASVSSNQTATVQSDASQDLLSAGSTVVSPVVPETLAPITPETARPAASVQTALAPETVTPAPAQPVASMQAPEALPTAPDTLAPLDSSSETAVLATTTASPVMAQSVKPVGQETIAPSSVTDARTAPVPQTLTIARPSTPTSFEPPPRRQQTAEPRPQRPQPSGNGGNNAADQTASRASTGAQASEGSGGDADVARYPSQVQTKLRRALRYPRSAGGAAGEVHVQFVVSSGGQPSGLRIVQSSGNAAIDQAGLETVSRAAPFPPIPPAANRGSWTFTIPLAFTR